MSSNSIYVPFSKVWSDEETNLLIELWDGSANYRKIKEHIPRFNREQIYSKAKYLNLPFNKKLEKWTPEEIDLLVKHWPSVRAADDILHLFSRWNKTAIDRKAYALKLKKNDDVQQAIRQWYRDSVIYRNQNILGEKQSYERCKSLASECKSRQEFKKKHDSVYCYARDNGFLDEICSHMIVGDSFSYPQAFLFECIKTIFPNTEIRYNDRKAIRPKELDIYLPELNLAFEYDGFEYHKDDDGTKDTICENAGIKLYRIKEFNKAKPEPHIIKALEDFGYDCSGIDIEMLTDAAFTKKITQQDIIQRVSKFKTVKEFRDNDKTLYIWLNRRKLFKKYCSELEQDPPSLTEDDIIKFFKTKSTKNEVLTSREGWRYYGKFKRSFKLNKEINDIWNLLK